MEPPENSNGILAWILGSTALGGTLWAVGAKVFSFVTRTELEKHLKAQREDFLSGLAVQKKEFEDAMKEQAEEKRRVNGEQHSETLRLHRENRETFNQIFKEISEVKTGQADLRARIHVSHRFNSNLDEG